MRKEKKPVFYGGQAVMEGVLMRGTKAYAMAVRRPNGEIQIIQKPLSTITERYSILKLPLLRGIIAFGSTLSMGFSALTQSAEIAMQEETQPTSRFERFLQEKLGDKLNDILMGVFMVLGVALALGLFMLLPAFIGTLLPIGGMWIGVAEGLMRIVIFVLYIFFISRSKDIQRFFGYHGAEHMAINCYEQKLPLTTENVLNHSRLHKRCGTSFMLVVMVITMILFMFLRIENIWLRFGSRILMLPVIAGLSYELSVKWAGRYDNWLVRAIIFPGMCLQRMTTAEPEADQIEVAVAALNNVLELESGVLKEAVKLEETELEEMESEVKKSESAL